MTQAYHLPPWEAWEAHPTMQANKNLFDLGSKMDVSNEPENGLCQCQDNRHLPRLVLIFPLGASTPSPQQSGTCYECYVQYIIETSCPVVKM